MQRKLHMNEYNQSHDDTALFELFCNTERLKKAFKSVKRNDGSYGIDGQTVKQFEANLENNLEGLKKELESWTYEPQPVRRVEIPKPGGGKRLLGIPCVRDRVVQAALKSLLEPLFEVQFSENSYGFRPGRNQQQAVAAALKIAQSGKEYVVDIDLSKFFDRINHDRLIARLGKTVQDKRILRLIGEILRSGVMENGLVMASTEGSPQGGPLSPLLSNIVLDELDKELERRNLEFCRYADDANIFVKSKKAAERVMQNISEFIEGKLKLKVNREKSKVAMSKDVKFLGMTIIMGTLLISSLSMSRAMDHVKELTPRGTYYSLEESIKWINRWYMGWAAYYKMTQYPSQLYRIEAHIRRRLRARIVRQQKSRRNLFNKLTSRHVTKRYAAVAYSNKRTWAMSHTKAVERAYPNKWFIEEMGLKIRSDESHAHWFGLREWIKLT